MRPEEEIRDSLEKHENGQFDQFYRDEYGSLWKKVKGEVITALYWVLDEERGDGQ